MADDSGGTLVEGEHSRALADVRRDARRRIDALLAEGGLGLRADGDDVVAPDKIQFDLVNYADALALLMQRVSKAGEEKGRADLRETQRLCALPLRSAEADAQEIATIFVNNELPAPDAKVENKDIRIDAAELLELLRRLDSLAHS